MAHSKPLQNKPLRLILLGKTGTGKSATGNSILGEKKFESKTSSTSVTKQSSTRRGTVLGRTAIVTDTPGLSDTELKSVESFQTVVQQISRAAAANPDGFDAALYVLVLGRQCKEDKDAIAQAKAIFSDAVFRSHGILTITHGDDYDPDENDGQTFEQWCQREGGFLDELINECAGRVLLMDNKTKDKNVRDQQLSNLMRLVEDISSNSEPLTSEILNLAQSSRDEMMAHMNEPEIVRESLEKLETTISKLREITGNTQEDLQQLQDLKHELETRRGEIEAQFQHSAEIPNELISTMNMAEKSVSDKISYIQVHQESEKQMKDMAEKFSEENENTKKEHEKAQEETKKKLAEMEDKHKIALEKMEKSYNGMMDSRGQGHADTVLKVMQGAQMLMSIGASAFDMYHSYKGRPTNVFIDRNYMDFRGSRGDFRGSRFLANTRPLRGRGSSTASIPPRKP